ncbi:MAG: nitroreductase family deazaflavin-dependent oxidoreductase [Thermomicrobiales bacterium]
MSSTAQIQSFNEQMIAEFRANGGRTTGPFANRPLLLLTTTGAKSGQRRTTPLVHTTDGDRLVVIASMGGAPTSPAWYHNLVANPVVTVELGTETFQARAMVAQEPERTRLYDQQAALMPSFAGYQCKTTRQIPVVILERLR